MPQIVLWMLPAALALALLGVAVMGRVTGWRMLARAYPARRRGAGHRLRVPWIYFGWTRYRNLVVAHADQAHLHLWVWLRVGHPPFSVPWSELSISRERRGLRKMLRLHFVRAPEVGVWLSEHGAARLLHACGGRVRMPAPADDSG
jgi:hypothetical protein